MEEGPTQIQQGARALAKEEDGGSHGVRAPRTSSSRGGEVRLLCGTNRGGEGNEQEGLPDTTTAWQI